MRYLVAIITYILSINVTVTTTQEASEVSTPTSSRTPFTPRLWESTSSQLSSISRLAKRKAKEKQQETITEQQPRPSDQGIRVETELARSEYSRNHLGDIDKFSRYDKALLVSRAVSVPDRRWSAFERKHGRSLRKLSPVGQMNLQSSPQISNGESSNTRCSSIASSSVPHSRPSLDDVEEDYIANGEANAIGASAYLDRKFELGPHTPDRKKVDVDPKVQLYLNQISVINHDSINEFIEELPPQETMDDIGSMKVWNKDREVMTFKEAIGNQRCLVYLIRSLYCAMSIRFLRNELRRLEHDESILYNPEVPVKIISFVPAKNLHQLRADFGFARLEFYANPDITLYEKLGFIRKNLGYKNPWQPHIYESMCGTVYGYKLQGGHKRGTGTAVYLQQGGAILLDGTTMEAVWIQRMKHSEDFAPMDKAYNLALYYATLP